MINCIRCGTAIPKANERNAKYITNPGDVRTHGEVTDEVYEVFDETNTKVDEKETLAAAEAVEQTKRNPIRTRVTNLLNQIRSDEQDAKRDVNPISKQQKYDAIKIRLAEVVAEQEKLTAVRVVSKSRTRTIPKTGIICLNPACQDPADTMIWGPGKTNR